MKYVDIPLGLGMALTQRPGGMQAFCALSEKEQQKFVENASNITSREEMRQYVNRLVDRF